jgi:GxxExxY protein
MMYGRLTFEQEKSMEIFYRGKKIGTRRVDFFVENCVMLEIKAVTELKGEHKAQAINYLEIYQMEVGLLLNFGSSSLEYKRLYNKNFRT